MNLDINWAGIWDTIVNFFVKNGWNIAIFFAILVVGIIVITIYLHNSKICVVACADFVVVIANWCGNHGNFDSVQRGYIGCWYGFAERDCKRCKRHHNHFQPYV